MLVAGAFELPQGLAEDLESKRLDGAVEGLLHFVFDLGGLGRLVA
jgi:hypothetical protein